MVKEIKVWGYEGQINLAVCRDNSYDEECCKRDIKIVKLDRIISDSKLDTTKIINKIRRSKCSLKSEE